MQLSKIVILLVFLCSCYYITSCRPQEISISPSGTDSLNSYTINDFCQDTSAISDTVVTILNGTHRLNTICDIKNANNVTLRAEHETKVVIKCENCGFRFLNVSWLKISDIEFISCGAPWQVKFDDPFIPVIIDTLVFVNGSNHILTNVKTIYNGICIENVAGNVTLDSCEVTNSSSTYISYNLTESATFKLINSLITNNNNSNLRECVYLFLETSRICFFIKNTTFSNNFCSGHMAIVLDSGSGACVSHVHSDSYSENLCKFLSITDSNFINGYGRSLSIYRYKYSLCKDSVSIDIVNTAFEHNYYVSDLLGGGVALDLQEKISVNTQPGVQFTVTVSRCTFVNNAGGSGVIVAIGVSYLRLDNITVESNNCTGIFAQEGRLVFSGLTRIANNHAFIGGGLHLVNSPVIELTQYADIFITNNSAQKTGGGIQLDHICTLNFLCSFSYTYYGSTNVTVTNNHALQGGDNFFGFYLCDGFIGISMNTRLLNSSFASKPVGMSFDGGQCTGHQDNHCYKHITLYPGQKVIYPVILLGVADLHDVHGVVSGSVMATVSGASILELEEIQRVGMSGSNVTYTLFSTNISRATIVVQPTEQNCGFNSPVRISIRFKSCPLGFNFVKVKQDRFTCQCASNIPTILNCSIQTQTITKRKNSWLGKYDLNDCSYLATSDYCPFDYCKLTVQDIRSDNSTLYQDEQCQYNRTGILCGSCPDGWSLVLGSSRCREECSNKWLLLILPFALAGILLVAVIHFLNLTVTMGTVSGLIFYANVCQDYSVALLSKYPISGLTPILYIFLSWLNLDLGISTCFYHGMKAFDKTMLLFVFPVYIWLISATIIALSNRYIFFTRLVGENAVKVLSTLFLLSYSKLFHAAIDSINFKFVVVYLNGFTFSEMRWAVDGNIPYFDSQKHLTLFVIALIFILLLFPFSVSLLCIRHVYSLSNCCRVFSCVDKLKPFFDTYTGPYKDRARFWTGLLLFVRLILIIIRSVDYSDHVIPYYIITAVCFLLSTVMNFLHGVYKRKWLNILEHFFILNIGIVFLVNSYKGGPDSWKSIFTHLLVSLAFLAFLGIIAYHIYLKFSPHCKRRFQMRPQNADSDMDSLSCEGMRGYQPLQQELNSLTQ